MSLNGYRSDRAMWSRDYLQRTIRFVTRIEMKPHRNHTSQHRRRRLNMKNASLGGPRTDSLNFFPLPHCDGYILIPRDLPVRLWYFVEENATDGKADSPSTARANLRTGSELANFRISGKSTALPRSPPTRNIRKNQLVLTRLSETTSQGHDDSYR
jgi:hypothetical protein